MADTLMVVIDVGPPAIAHLYRHGQGRTYCDQPVPDSAPADDYTGQPAVHLACVTAYEQEVGPLHPAPRSTV